MFNISFGRRKPLSQLELRVLEVVWEKQSATAEDVREALASEKPMKESTVRTLLRRLELKGYLTHRTSGRTYVYQAKEEPKELAASAVRQIIDNFCGGSVEQLLTGMVDAEVIDAAELRRLSQRIGAAGKKRRR